MPHTDLLLRLSSHRWTARALRRLGLPTPVLLQRPHGPWLTTELQGLRAQVLGLPDQPPEPAIGDSLDALGAHRADDPHTLLDIVIADARHLRQPAQLVALHRELAPCVAQLAPCARIVLLTAQPHSNDDAPRQATLAALTGFARSLGKEIGARGAGINVLQAPDTLTPGLSVALAFFASHRSAYISGQILQLQTPSDSATAGWASALAGQQAVVTGAAQGIGRETAVRLAAQGAHVICVDIPAQQASLQALATQIDGSALPLDITASNAGEQLAACLHTHGGVDVLVHNAGITRDRLFSRMRDTQWRDVLAVNLQAVIAVDAALDAHALWRPGARSIYLSSISGIAGNRGQTNYAAAKAGLIGYVKARATTMVRHHGSANAVAPGFIETAMTQRLPWGVIQAGRRLNALGQAGHPSDVAEAVVFLGHPASTAISGQILRVCGQSFLGA